MGEKLRVDKLLQREQQRLEQVEVERVGEQVELATMKTVHVAEEAAERRVQELKTKVQELELELAERRVQELKTKVQEQEQELKTKLKAEEEKFMAQTLMRARMGAEGGDDE